MEEFVSDRVLEKTDFGANPPRWREYERCTFRNCNLFGSDLSGIRFTSCRFENCDLSLSNIGDSVMQNAVFSGCKALGVRFDHCSRFGFSVTFGACLIDNSSFRGMKLKKTVFRDCQLHEADFSECDLTGASFDGCDLTGAVFHFTVLVKADLRGATGFSIDPETNKLKGARFSVYGLPGLVGKYGIVIEEV